MPHSEGVRECVRVVNNTSTALAGLGEKQAALTTTAVAMVQKMMMLLEGVKETREEMQTDSVHQKQLLNALLATESTPGPSGHLYIRYTHPAGRGGSTPSLYRR